MPPHLSEEAVWVPRILTDVEEATPWIMSRRRQIASYICYSGTCPLRWRSDGYTNEDGAKHHHMPIPPGCVRVGVDEVVSGFETLELDFPRGDDEKTMADINHGFTLWPKKYIVLLQGPPTPRTSPPEQERPLNPLRSGPHEQQRPWTPPGSSPQEQQSPPLPERDPSVSPPSRDPPRKTVSFKRNGTSPRKRPRKEKP